MSSRFEDSLGAAVGLLRDLPRGHDDAEEARRRVKAFGSAYPSLRAELVVDRPPASRSLEYDLLLEHPDGGTLAVSWRRDDGTPWLVDHSDHWASNYVVSVGGQHLTIEDVLRALLLRRRHQPELMEDLVREAVLRRALAADPPEVSAEEVQRAADDFRSANGLFDADATRHWLQSMGLSLDAFRDMLRGGVQTRKLRERITRERLDGYFAEHRAEFDVVRFVRADCSIEATAAQLAETARRCGGLAIVVSGMLANENDSSINGMFGTDTVGNLPRELATAPAGTIVGPVASGTHSWVGEVLARTPAALDNPDVRRSVESRVFAQWVEEECTRDGVRWHWISR